MDKINSIAIIYDNTSHPMTTGEYCRRALEKMCNVTHFHPRDLDYIQPHAFDLYLNIDDSFRYILPVYLKPAVWWVIDTHLQYEWDLEKARLFDIVFVAQRDGVKRLMADGVRNVFWLPLACDPDIHGNYPVEKIYDWCFVGTTEPKSRFEERVSLIRLMSDRFPNGFCGSAFGEEMTRIFSSSRVVFNRSVKNDINMRVFEAISTGSLLVTNNLDENGMAGLLEDGKDYVSYKGPEELLEKVSYYLDNPAERELIAQRGMQTVHKRHTYKDRMETLLSGASEIISGRYTEKGVNYYHSKRPDLLDKVPHNVKRVLEIGCGAGVLGGSIKKEYGAYVAGIELIPEAVSEARQRLDRVIHGDCEVMDFYSLLGDERFDCMILGDVLEHMREPQIFLQRIKPFLTEDATVVASIPNVRNISILSELAGGNWTYTDYGILDKTHLRFFTRREIEKLFKNAGYTIGRIYEKYDASYHRWVNQGMPEQFRAGALTCGPLPGKSLKDLFVYQYLVMAMAEVRVKPASIIVLTFNGLEFVRLCLESVIEHTDAPYELIVVDNGSDKDVIDYLEGVQKNITARMHLIRNGENKGFPYGCNQGIMRSKGDYIVLLNSDTIVTDGWLSGLINTADTDPDIGIVGPLTNNTLPGDQMIPRGYTDIKGLVSFAEDIRNRNKGKLKVLQDPDFLTGFCLLIKREVIDNIGLLDAHFGIGTFEDNDYCWRARAGGYKPAIAQDVFIHHRLMGSFESNNIDIDRTSQGNLAYFNRKMRINGYKEVDVNMEEEGKVYCNDGARIISVTINSVPYGHKRVYRFNISYSAGPQEGCIEVVIRDIKADRFSEIIETGLTYSLMGTEIKDDPQFINLCKKVIRDTLELKLIKLPVPEKVTFLMNSRVKQREAECSLSA